MKAIQIFNEKNVQELYNTPVPVKTSTYSPVSHKNVVERIHEEAYKNNFILKNFQINAARDFKQVIGYMDYETGDTDMGIRVGFRNSYDKSMSFALVIGNTVWICSNGMISGEIQTKKIHRGDQLTSLIEDKIINGFSLAEEVYRTNKESSELFKDVLISEDITHQITGQLFLEDKILNSMQLNCLKDQLYSSENFATIDSNHFSAWDLYNHVTESLKLTHPSKYLQNHIDFHNVMKDYFI